MAKTMVIVGTLDTKGDEIQYIQRLIEARGHQTVVIDTGNLGAATNSAAIEASSIIVGDKKNGEINAHLLYYKKLRVHR